MGAYEDACTDLIYDKEGQWNKEQGLPRYRIKLTLPIYLYFMNWLVASQGHRRAGSLSQHALSERQENTLDIAPVYHRANKDTDNIAPVGVLNWRNDRKNTQPPHRTEEASNFLLWGIHT